MKTNPPRKEKDPKNNPFKFAVKFQAGVGGIFQPGTNETITIEILDGYAIYHFLNPKYTKAFSLRQQKDGLKSIYNERLKKTICTYEGQTKEQIMDKTKDDLIALGGKKCLNKMK